MDVHRIGLVVHPSRDLDRALAAIRGWADGHGAGVVQIPTEGQDRRVAEPGEAASCEVILALGGDGTTLIALAAGAAAGRPVLGVACGSLGALTACTADWIADSLERFAAGRWEPRVVPGLEVAEDDQPVVRAVNDLVLVRAGAGQVTAAVHVDGELFSRFAGDGVVVATPLGSSAYTLGAGGPVLTPSAQSMVVTPIAVHGGCCPPLVTGSDSTISVRLEPSHAGARMELDGRVAEEIGPQFPRTFAVHLVPHHATLVTLGSEETMLAGLRRRRILIDSPRILARDEREALGVTQPQRQ